MFRENGILPPITKSKYPKRLIVFDTEALRGDFVEGVEQQSYRLGVGQFIELKPDLSIKDNEWFHTQDKTALVDWFEWQTRKDKALYIYAHNIKYDLQLSGALRLLLERGWLVSTIVFEDPPTFIKLHHERKTIIFVDTFNYWQFSVATMGKQLGIEKMAMPAQDDNNDSWVTYCKRDVEVLSLYLLRFMEFLHTNELAGLGLTLASQAFRTYRAKFMPPKINLHNYDRVTTLERGGYSGGRVEAYQLGTLSNVPLYKLDVNSMYPFVMKEYTYPCDLVGHSENLPLDRLPELMAKGYCLADVTLETEKPAYPLKAKHKLIFPIGKFRTVLHDIELREAMNYAKIISIHEIALYNAADLFSGYVDFFYQLKQEAERQGDIVQRQMAKIFLNSLYGKFGQRGTQSFMMDNPGVERYDRVLGFSESKKCTIEMNYLGTQIEVRWSEGESAYSYPCIAGAVTANARLYLWSLMVKAGLSNCFYVDTDSLIVNDEGLKRLETDIDPFTLGKLKLEKQSDGLTVYGLKDYIFGGEIKHKGLPVRAEQIEDNLWAYDQFEGAKTWLKDGMKDGVNVYKRTKARKGLYDKGTVLEDGKVIPLLLGG